MAFQKAKAVAQAQRFITRGQFKKAIALYERIVRNDPDDVRSQLKLGDLLIQAGEDARAAQMLRLVAQHYTEQGFTLKAVAVYKQILRIQPDLADVAHELARQYQQMGQPGDAIEQYVRAANLYAQQGRARERFDTICQMLELDPGNVRERLRVAEELSAAGQIQQAVRMFREVADTLLTKERFDLFVPVAARLLHHAPQDIEVSKALAGRYLSQGDAKRALPRLRVCFHSNPEDLEVLDLLQQTFDLMGQPHKAISVLKEMARVYDRAGLADERDQIQEQILILDGEDESARKALRVAAEVEASRAAEFELDHEEIVPDLYGGPPQPARPAAGAGSAAARERAAAPPAAAPARPAAAPKAAVSPPPAASPLPATSPLPVAGPAAPSRSRGAAADERGPKAALSKPHTSRAVVSGVRSSKPRSAAAASPGPARPAKRSQPMLDVESELELTEEAERTLVSDLDALRQRGEGGFENEAETLEIRDPRDASGVPKARVDVDAFLRELESLDETFESGHGVVPSAVEPEAPKPPPQVPADDARAVSMPGPVPQTLTVGLQEVDFYIDNELFDDAVQLLRELLLTYPGHPEIRSRLQKLSKG